MSSSPSPWDNLQFLKPLNSSKQSNLALPVLPPAITKPQTPKKFPAHSLQTTASQIGANSSIPSIHSFPKHTNTNLKSRFHSSKSLSNHRNSLLSNISPIASSSLSTSSKNPISQNKSNLNDSSGIPTKTQIIDQNNEEDLEGFFPSFTHPPNSSGILPPTSYPASSAQLDADMNTIDSKSNSFVINQGWKAMIQVLNQSKFFRPLIPNSTLLSVFSQPKRLRFPLLCLKIAQVEPLDISTQVLLQDSCGYIEATIHKEVVALFPIVLTKDTCLALYQISIFQPIPQARFVNITLRNIAGLFGPDGVCYVFDDPLADTTEENAQLC